MRLAACSWLAAGMWLSACSGGYPLAPTGCDKYCHATRDLQCGFYDPAGCVSQCERELKGDVACHAELGRVLSCFDATNAAKKRCLAYDSYPPNYMDSVLCEAELDQLDTCSSTLRPANAPQPGEL